MKKSLIVVLAGILLTACSNDSREEEISSVVQNQDYSVSIEEALSVAEYAIGQIDEAVGKTRSTTRRVAEIRKIKAPKTRNTNFDGTLFYIVNYENNDGFAILGADQRIDPILAISDEGNLNLSDTVENKGLAMVYSRIIESSLQNIGIDTRVVSPINPGFPSIINYHVSPPMLSYVASRWSGNIDFIVAMKQYLSYFRCPTVYEGQVLDWDSDTFPNEINLSALLHVYESSDMMNVQYGMITPVFSNLGYSSGICGAEFNINQVINRLKDNVATVTRCPVIIDGFYPYSDISGPHSRPTFIADGCITYNNLQVNPGINNEDVEVRMIHCVWGTGGTNNGYYQYNYDPNLIEFGGEAHGTAPNDDEIPAGTTQTFYYACNTYHSFLPLNQ